MLVRVGDSVVLALPQDDIWHILPGGPVEPGESTEHALARQLGELDVPGLKREFLGAAEHAGGELGNASDPKVGHTLTVLFTADWPAGTPLPAAWNGHRLVTVDARVLIATRLRPLPVAAAVRRWLMEQWPVWRGMTPSAGDTGRLGRRLSVASLRAQLAARRASLRSNAFRDAAVAICALVTAADGRIDPAEREALRAFVASDPVMSNFPPHELEALFDTHLARLSADFSAGREAALGEIAKVRGRPAEAAALVHLGEVIGRSDGEFVASEQAVLRDAIEVLGLDPAEFVLPALDQPAA